MKKIVALVLVCVLAISLWGCDGFGGTPELRVGYARERIMPADGTPLGGYGNSDYRVTDGGFLDYLYTTCIAVTDQQDNTVLMITADLIVMNNDMLDVIERKVTEATGLPVENLMIAATHTHSSPDVDYYSNGMIPIYWELVAQQTAKAAVAALKDRMEAHMSIGTIDTEQLNFVRHVELDDGTFAGDNFGDFTDREIVDYESEADPQLQVLKFDREDGKDVVLANWQAHATKTGGSSKTDISADFIGSFRAYAEKSVDCLFAYFQGAAGNLNGRSYIEEDDCTADYKIYGQLLAGYAKTCLDNNMKQIDVGQIKLKTMEYEAYVDHSDDKLVAEATLIKNYWNQTNDRLAAVEMGKEYGINSPYHAMSIISNAARGETEKLTITAFSIGDISFITAPYEMFDTQGMYIKNNTPFEMTFIMGYCDGSFSYIASEIAYEHGCYEVDTGHFVKGTAEKLAQQYVQMLNEIKGE